MENTKIQIPKRLFFIWFGNSQPKYVDFCIQNFKRVNLDFEIVFLRKTVKEIEEIWLKNVINDEYDEVIKRCSFDIINECGIYEDYIKNQKYNLYKKDLRFIQLLGDIVRVELINEFGGIYLDCDTFPLKSFDHELLKLDSFCVKRHYLEHISPDNYFIGSKSRKFVSEIKNPLKFDGKMILQTNKNWFSNVNFWKNKRNFFLCELNDNNLIKNGDFYIEHYNTGTWSKKYGNKINIPFCEMDK